MRKSLILLPFLLVAAPALAQSTPGHEVAYGTAALQKFDFSMAAAGSEATRAMPPAPRRSRISPARAMPSRA
jgi:hypothetical protein